MSLFCLCVVDNIGKNNPSSFYMQQVEALARRYDRGVKFFVDWPEPIVSCFPKDSFIINISDNAESDNCEMFLLPDGWYFNGFTNDLPFRERMRFLQDISYIFSKEECNVGLYFGLSGTSPEDFQNISLRNDELVDYLSNTIGVKGIDDGIHVNVVRGDTASSTYSVNIDFDALVKAYREVLTYSCKYSDSFSVITTVKDPYLINRVRKAISKKASVFIHDDIMKNLEPFLSKSILGVKEWPETELLCDNHRALLRYELCEECQREMQKMPNWFQPIENGLPEDICFYRKGEPWLATVSHEKMAFTCSATEADIVFLQNNNIDVWY